MLRSTTATILLLAVVLLCCTVSAGLHVSSGKNIKTFSTAMKAHRLCPCETCSNKNCTGCMPPFDPSHTNCIDSQNFEAQLYNYTASSPGVIRMLWFTGELASTTVQGNMTIRIYVDSEVDQLKNTRGEPALSFKLYEAHAMGFGWDQGEQKIWGTKNFGKGSLFGGLYMTFHIPFERKFLITAELPDDVKAKGDSWIQYFICRGLLNVPPMLDGGAFQLPPSAKLTLQKTEFMNVASGTTLVIGNATNSAGAVFLVTMEAEGNTPHYLEGEFKAILDNAPMTLSSGTEDYFLSANYFNAGEFQFENSGANHVDLACLDPLKKGWGICRIAAYRFHEADPIFFNENMQMTWEAGDNNHGDFKPIRVRFYVWTYLY